MAEYVDETTGLVTTDPSQLPALSEANVPAAREVASVFAEMKAAIMLAKEYPRDENAAWQRIMDSMRRLTLAEKAAYKFPRGGSQIEGPTAALARSIARLWGNIRYGFYQVKSNDYQIHLRGFAWDLETGAKTEMDDTFKPLIQRKVGKGDNATTKWVTPDERDLRELVNRRGSILERNCILKILPPDFVEDAMAEAKRTIAGKIKDVKGEIKKLIMDYSAIGVTVDMLVDYLGYQSDQWGPDQIADLKMVLNSIKDGVAKRDEYFPSSKDEKPPVTKTDELAGKVKAQTDPTKQGELL